MAAAATVAEGFAQKQEADFQSDIQKQNARVLRENAYRKRLETSINEDTMRRENRQKIARNIAASIEQGMGESSTTIGALGQEATKLEQNALNLRYEGLSAGENLAIQANYMNQQAKASKIAGKNAFNMSLIKAPISALSAYYTAGGSAGLGKAAEKGWTSLGGGVTTRGGSSSSTRFYSLNK
jgi:hypothetical protein